MTKEIVENSAILNKVQDDLTSINYEISLIKMAYSILVVDLAEVSLKESYQLMI